MNPRRGRGRGYYQKPMKVEPEIPQNLTDGKMSTSKYKEHGKECCGEIKMNLDLNYQDQVFFDRLKSLWKMLKKSQPVIDLLTNYYLQYQSNPYEQTLRLMYACQDFHSAKAKSLPFFIIEQFASFIDQHPVLRCHLIDSMKLDAYKLMIKQNTPSLTKLVAEIYEMSSSGEIFLDLVKCMIRNKQYKEACQSIILLGIQERFSLEDCLIPLIYQDKLFLLDDYLTPCPRLQEEVVVYLDNILGMPSVRHAAIEFASNHNVSEVKWEKMHSKPFKKLITRLMKKFNLPSHLTPNLNKRRNAGTLHFLLHKRYIEEGFSDESWKEMIQEAVGDDFDLQKELVVQVACYGDVAEALKWAHFYHIDREYWPYGVRLYADDRWTEPTVTSQEETEYWDEPQPPLEYHKLALSIEDIHFVDNAKSFQEFLDPGLKDVDIVGIDCEWKPSFGGQKSELALMQISSRNKVFILDVPALSLIAHAWHQLDKALFNKCDILKLGFGFISDVSVIKGSISGLSFSTNQIGFLDLLSLWRLLEKHPHVVFPHGQTSGLSLSNLVQQCLGAPLDKSEQFSNWDKRPLRTSQLVYAALDAYCLIEIYDVIKHCCEDAAFPFEEVCYNLMTNENFPKKKNKKPAKKDEQKSQVDIPQPESHVTEEIPADRIKLVCDTMLQGLGKKLRRCGVDTAILENDRDHMECVRIALNEQRYILTKGTVFNKLVGYVVPGYCYKVISDDIDVQIKEVLAYYHIKVTKDHVFSRCQFCNGDSFVKVCSSTMKMMASRNAPPRYLTPPLYSMEVATGFSSDEDFNDEEPGPPIVTCLKKDAFPDEKIDVGLCQTRMGAHIQMAHIPEDILNNVDMFHICEECGKVYWDGSHFGRVVHGALHGIVQ
ncbi:hypothetical protein WA026_013649 [Henosepilachna vigintioctopunctata]|uniref:3'-5' exonuclease domain-containing protein n=1 Tax=Henosepilachna vigintioctopunctata TaxID=420089 RepID=A0AAW1V1N9_9CUCU